MKCIVTAGPTYEELDEVRRLTNFSTGTLGTELANYLTEQGHEVELLLGHYATCRIEPKARRVQMFTTTDDLRQKLRKFGSPKVGAVFHAAAVSDFRFGRIFTRKLKEVKSAKISTRGENLLVELKPTAKIIANLRKWFPQARLVGWKYELEGKRAGVLEMARRQIVENGTDACVVNGRAYGKGFGLMMKGRQPIHLAGKKELFEALSP